MFVVAFDPGKTTGYCVVKLGKTDDPEIINWGEISKPALSKKVLQNLTRGCTDIVVERAVLTGRLNEDKVDQIRVTERIDFLGEGKVRKVSPEEKRLVKDVPKEIKGDHARDAYKLLNAWLLRKE